MIQLIDIYCYAPCFPITFPFISYCIILSNYHFVYFVQICDLWLLIIIIIIIISTAGQNRTFKIRPSRCAALHSLACVSVH